MTTDSIEPFAVLSVLFGFILGREQKVKVKEGDKVFQFFLVLFRGLLWQSIIGKRMDFQFFLVLFERIVDDSGWSYVMPTFSSFWFYFCCRLLYMLVYKCIPFSSFWFYLCKVP